MVYWAVYRRRYRSGELHLTRPVSGPSPEGAVDEAERGVPEGSGWEFLFIQEPRPPWAPRHWLSARQRALAS